jgi:hypothetical protein
MEIRIKADSFRRPLTLVNSPDDPERFVLTATGYQPVQIEASSAGEAVDRAIAGYSMMRRTATSEAVASARSERMRAWHAANRAAAESATTERFTVRRKSKDQHQSEAVSQ